MKLLPKLLSGTETIELDYKPLFADYIQNKCRTPIYSAKEGLAFYFAYPDKVLIFSDIVMGCS